MEEVMIVDIEKFEQTIKEMIKSGKIIKPQKCEVCDKKKLLQGHHEDYTEPLQVIWLCSGCHADEHKEILKEHPTKNTN